jgi:hypothetical protein
MKPTVTVNAITTRTNPFVHGDVVVDAQDQKGTSPMFLLTPSSLVRNHRCALSLKGLKYAILSLSRTK